ncbi:MAG: flagellar basal body rod C-terminal domain-containing protein, partial [Deferrisomatales bacterium]
RVTSPGPQVIEAGAEGPEPVELSNVDLGEEMVGMLVGERGFELNLKTLQVADEMLGALLDLKG